MNRATTAIRDRKKGLRGRHWPLYTLLAAVISVGGLVAVANPAAAATPPQRLICSGGDFGTFTPALIPSGTYQTVLITGFCEIAPGASVVVRSGLSVASTGFLVAAAALDNGMHFPDCNRTITVSGGVHVAPGGSLILGDGPGSGCDPSTKTTVNGGIDAKAPLFLIIHGVTANGGISSVGGGDNLPCNFQGLPTYATVEDSHVNGGVSVSGYRACWLGFARNHINGGVTLTNNKLDDPDAMEILSNSINGGLACSGNTAGGVPRATNFADGPPPDFLPIFEPNSVHGKESGQCAGL